MSFGANNPISNKHNPLEYLPINDRVQELQGAGSDRSSQALIQGAQAHDFNAIVNAMRGGNSNDQDLSLGNLQITNSEKTAVTAPIQFENSEA